MNYYTRKTHGKSTAARDQRALAPYFTLEHKSNEVLGGYVPQDFEFKAA